MDFNDNALRIRIRAGETTANFNVPVTVDNIFEGTEHFGMRIDLTSGARRLMVEVGPQGTANGEIIDDGK